MREFEIVIVGAGIAGASLAWHLTRHAALYAGGRRSVLLLEREAQPGVHATGRSAAMFMESYGPSQVRALTRASRSFYLQPPAGFTEQPLLTPRGVLYLATHEQQALLHSHWASMTAAGQQVALVDADAVLAQVPCLRPELVAGAIAEPDAQDIDVHALHQGFLHGCRAAGTELRCDAEVVSATPGPQGWVLRLADGETLQARSIVNAAGAWADVLALRCGVAPLGLEPRRRSAFTFKAPDGVDPSRWPAVVGIDESYYFKPDAGRLLGSPANADATVPHDVQPEELDIALGIHQIEAVTTLTIRRPASTWAGLRTFAPDGEIVIGPDPARPGFFWLAGQGGYGIQSAAGAGALAAALLCGEPVPEALVAAGVQARAAAPDRLR